MRWKSLLLIVFVFMLAVVLSGFSEAVSPSEERSDIFREILTNTITSLGLDPNTWSFDVYNTSAEALYQCGNGHDGIDVALHIETALWGISEPNTTFHGLPAYSDWEGEAGYSYSHFRWVEDGYLFWGGNVYCSVIPEAAVLAEALYTQAHKSNLWQDNNESAQPTTPPAQPTTPPAQPTPENSCIDQCVDHCEGNVAYSAFDCVDGECEWVTRECPFGCDANLPGMCVEAEGYIVVQAAMNGYEPQQFSVENPEPNGSMTISGQVVDQKTGEPIAGAIVSVISGAQVVQVSSDQNGYFELLAAGNSLDVMSTATLNFSLEPINEVQIDIALEDIPMYPAGTSIVESTMDVSVAVYDPTGNLLTDRVLVYEALDPNWNVWGTFSGDQSTQQSGYQVQTLTAGSFEFGTVVGSGMVPITVRVTDVVTGVQATAVFDVEQIKIEVDYHPILATCSNCGPYPIKVKLVHPLGDVMSGAALIAGIVDGEGFLTDQKFGESGSQEMNLVTDQNGMATFYFKPQMGDLTQVNNFSIYVIHEGAGVVEAVPIRAEPVDFGISRLEPVNFSGNTGDNAYFNIGVRELNFRTAPLDRFGLDGHSPINYMVTIRQTFPEISLTNSVAYGEQVNLVSDGQGGFRLKDDYSNPPTPHVVPTNFGVNVYEVEVIAVDSVSGNAVYDSYLGNNDTAVVIDASTPANWFHTYMMNGVLTPHSHTQALIKCAASFLPVSGNLISAVDALNEAYKAGYGSTDDAVALGQKTVDQIAGAIGEHAENTVDTDAVSGIGKRVGVELKALKAVGFVGNVLGCVKDHMGVEVEYAQRGLFSTGDRLCCLNCSLSPDLVTQTDQIYSYEDMNVVVVPFIQQLVMTMPEYQAVMVLSSPGSSVSVMSDYGDLPDVYSFDGVHFFMLPKGERFQVYVFNAAVVDVVVFDDGQDIDNSLAMHYIERSSDFGVSFEVSDQADYSLLLDYDQDGTPDETVMPEFVDIDLVAPTIQLAAPTTTVAGFTMIRAEYDDQGGSGIRNESVRIFIDGIEVTSYADIDHVGFSLPVSGLTPGEYLLRINVSDWNGNQANELFSITSTGMQAPLSEMLFFPSIGACGLGGIGAIVLAVLLLRRRKRSGTVQARKKGRKWVLYTVGGVVLLCAVLGTAGLLYYMTDTSGLPYAGSVNMFEVEMQPNPVPELDTPPTQSEIDAYWQEFNEGLLLPDGPVYQTLP